MKKILPLLLILAIALISCTANVANPSDYDENTWEGLFKQYWTVMDEDYVHFSRNDLNWDDMYNKYLPEFQKLDYNNESDTLKAFKLFKEMSKDITDYHYELTVSDKFGRTLSFSPSLEKKWMDKNKDVEINDFPDIADYDNAGNFIRYLNANGNVVTEDARKIFLRNAVNGAYEVSDLGDNFHGGKTIFTVKKEGSITDLTNQYKDSESWKNFISKLEIADFSYFFGVTSECVAYFYISAFPSVLIMTLPIKNNEGKTTSVPLYQLYASDYYKKLTEDEKKSIDSFSSDFSDVVIKELNSIGREDAALGLQVKGTILDVRSNGGGAVAFLNLVFANFFSEDKVIGYTRYKDGYGEYDYTPWTEMKLTKVLDTISRPDHDYDKPFAILTNEASVSCSEISTIAVKYLMKNGRQFGIKTWGGTCVLTDRNRYQSGPYTNSAKNLSVYTTTYQFKDINGKSWESEGLTPDEEITLETLHDNVFDAAVKWIKSGSN